MDLFTLAARLTMDTTAFITQMNQASNKGELFAAKLHTAFKASALGIVNALSKVSASALSLVGDLAKSGFEYNVKMEEYQTSFQTLLGSTEKAAQRVQQLKEMAAKTPFGMSDLAEATKTLLAFQVEESKTNDVLSMLGDIALGNKEKLSGLALVFGQVSSAGKLSGQDLMQFINQGFNPLNYIAQRTGESMEVLRERMSKGKVTVQEVERAFVDATSEGGQFYKGMDTASQTTSGLWSTLKDNFDEFKGKLMEPVNDAAKNTILPFLLDSLEKISNALYGVEKAAEPLFGGEDVAGKNNNIFTRIFEAWSDGLPEDDQLVQDFINELKSNTSLIEQELANRIENLDGKYGAVEVEGYKSDLDAVEKARSEYAEILRRRQNGIFTAEDTKNLENNRDLINDIASALSGDGMSGTEETPWAKFVGGITKLVTDTAGTWVDKFVESVNDGSFNDNLETVLENAEGFIEDVMTCASALADLFGLIGDVIGIITDPDGTINKLMTKALELFGADESYINKVNTYRESASYAPWDIFGLFPQMPDVELVNLGGKNPYTLEDIVPDMNGALAIGKASTGIAATSSAELAEAAADLRTASYTLENVAPPSIVVTLDGAEIAANIQTRINTGSKHQALGLGTTGKFKNRDMVR